MKNTPLSSAVLEILEHHAKPLSVPALLDLLGDRGLTPNKTSLYRLLEKLMKAGQVESVLLSDKTAHYELSGHHHHHFVCQDCDDIQCIEDPKLEQRIHQLEDQLKAAGLQVKQHQFSISGSCSSCQ